MIEKEYRTADLNVDKSEKENNELIVCGYAITFNKPTILYKKNGIEYKEVIERNALNNADLSDIIMRYNHNDNCEILARTTNNTLTYEVNENGLKIFANIAKTSYGKDIYTLIKRQDINKMSFAFVADKTKYDSKTHTRHILSIAKVYDVSAVDNPAYDSTTLQVLERSFEKAEQENENDLKRKRLYIKAQN